VPRGRMLLFIDVAQKVSFIFEQPSYVHKDLFKDICNKILNRILCIYVYIIILTFKKYIFKNMYTEKTKFYTKIQQFCLDHQNN